jgi:hypothetical protein
MLNFDFKFATSSIAKKSLVCPDQSKCFHFSDNGKWTSRSTMPADRPSYREYVEGTLESGNQLKKPN